MLARRLAGILPPMSFEETLDVTRIYSVAGLFGEHARLVRRRPFRSPHQHVSAAGLIGGGAVLARPGEVSLAHRGVLFLDEVALYRAEVLDSLRGPLEEGMVRIARSGGVVTFPCSFSLVAAMNPCPCGLGEEDPGACRCSAQQLQAYGARLSGLLLDRLDIQVRMSRLGKDELLGAPSGEPSAVVRERVTRARDRQLRRYGTSLAANGSVPKPILEAHLGLTPDARAFVGEAIDSLSLTGRGLDRSLRVARTIADLESSAEVSSDHVGEAVHLRLAEAPTRVTA
jgi:magnesium chelatase family protein